MNRQQRITDTLVAALKATVCDVVDESHRHAGHAGASPEGETHYKVTISSPLFEDKTIIQCHRLVNEALKEEFQTGLHALSIKIVR